MILAELKKLYLSLPTMPAVLLERNNPGLICNGCGAHIKSIAILLEKQELGIITTARTLVFPGDTRWYTHIMAVHVA